MSDPLSNREIEDVLISIRRLVAQEGGRTSETTRLVLTEAQRVLDQVVQETPTQGAADIEPQATDSVAPEASRGGDMPAPDFGQLEATIAELEAAVSTSGQTWESEADTAAPAVSNVTELYGRLNFNRRPVPAPEPEPEIAPAADASAIPQPAAPEVQVDMASAEPATVPDDADASEPQAIDAGAKDETGYAVHTDPAEEQEAPSEVTSEHVEADMVTDISAAPDSLDDIDTAADPDDTFLDEEMLRALIAQMVRDELHGQLGERITQQVRKLVRAEIAKALADRTVF